MIDTHSHLWFKHFDDDREAVIKRAQEAGVHTMVQVGCDEETSIQAMQMAGQYEFMWATVGLHPTEVKDLNKADLESGSFLQWIKRLVVSSEKIVAIGEIGIDYYHEPYDREAQMQALQLQCEVAQEVDLPVVIHLRATKRPEEGRDGMNEAERDCLHVLDEVGMKEDKVVFHCFSGGNAMAEEIVKRGWLISFSGVVTYPNSSELREIAAEIPLEQIVVETDCPFLPPQQYRGERNEPSYVIETARIVAQARGIELNEFERASDNNAKRVFGI